MIDKNRLRAAIVREGHTQRTLAEKVGVSVNTISAKLNRRIPFNTDEIEKICEVLSITDPAEKVQIFLAPSSQNRDIGR